MPIEGIELTRNVLLVFHSTGDRRLSINILPPLGILSIASYLEERGIHTDVIDSSLSQLTACELESYDVIGFSINISNSNCSLKAIANIKKAFPNKPIVVGGPLCMSNPRLFFQNPYIDAIFECEGEEAFFEYLISNNKENLKGVHIRKGSDFLFYGPREWIKDLNTLPFPAFDKVDITKYNNVPKKKRPISSMITSRGCPFNCIFCSHSMGKKWRPRSADNVVKEIKWQMSEFGVKEICIYDDNFSLDKRRAEMICDQLIEDRVPVTLQFTNGLRVDCLNTNLLYKLKKAGTWLIGIAPEVGNPEVMQKIKKGFKYSQVLEIKDECKRLGIKTFGFFMIGFPFETKDNILETIEFAKKLDADIVEFNKVIPYEKTELYDMMVKNGTLLAESNIETQSYHQGTITTHRVGNLSKDEVKQIIRKAYRDYYLRPKKMINLLQTFCIRDLWQLITYAISTRNI